MYNKLYHSVFQYVIYGFIIFAETKELRRDEICGRHNGRRIYVESNDQGVLEARTQPHVFTNEIGDGILNKQNQCSLELVTCPSCIINIKFSFLNISRNCGGKSVLENCGCDYVWIYEPPFEEASGEQFCGYFGKSNETELSYKSQTRSTAINFFYTHVHQRAFILEYSSERSRHVFEGFPYIKQMNNANQFISSPFFPNFYPRDLNTEYVITCKSEEHCKVRLMFTDFHLSTNSLIEFFDWNGQRMHVTTGSIFRPPLLISNGPSMTVRFYANGGSNKGFKANYMFVLSDADNSTIKPDTDCGGYIDNLGGRITMTSFTKETKAYDCYWIIRPPTNYFHLKTHIYLKIISFSDFAGNTELIIRRGLTSNEPAIDTLRHPVSYYLLSNLKEHTTPIGRGFYISLKGLFKPDSKVALSYSAFNYKDCYSNTDFLCRNLRCIPVFLICDGFDHCGDNSDETTNCIKNVKDRDMWSHTPNFFFPKTDKFSYLKTATIVFVLSSLGLITLIFALIGLLYRMNAKNGQQQRLQTHLQTINDILEEGQLGVTEEEFIISDDPPIYEEPPNYEDVIKNYPIKRKILQITRPCSRCNNTRELLPTTAINDIEPEAGTSQACKIISLPIFNGLPPPYYPKMPTLEITDLTENVTLRIIGKPFQYFSLPDLHVKSNFARRFKSSDGLSRCENFNEKVNSQICIQTRSLLRKNIWLSDSELQVSIRMYKKISNEDEEDEEEEENTTRLRRSASIENLFTI